MIPVKITLPLNIRKGAGKGFTKIGEIYPSGKIINMDGVKEDGIALKNISKWYYKKNDRNEMQWYWGGRIEEVAMVGATPNYQDWMVNLKLPEIWKIYKELGSNAKVAVLDTGYNLDNPELKSAVFGEYLAFPTAQGLRDNNGHGSLCCSLIGARNNTHIIGCAPSSELYVAKISDRGELSYNLLVKGIIWAIQQGVDIISISYGGGKSR